MSTFKQYLSLLRVLIKNSYGRFLSFFNPKANSERKSVTEFQERIDSFNREASAKRAVKNVFLAVGVLVGVVAILLYICLIAYSYTAMGVSSGHTDEVLYLFLGLSQAVVLFLGVFAVLNYLYFSSDNTLILSLPLDTKAVFMAKFTMAYLSEVLLSALFIIPTATTFAVTVNALGGSIPAWFYVLEVLAVVTLPVVPLVVISIVSMPLMYLVSYLRQRKVASSIATALVGLIIFGLYFALIGSFSGNITDAGTQAPSDTLIAVLTAVKNGTIFNKFLVGAMLGRNIALNSLSHIATVAGGATLAVLLSAVFYPRAVNSLVESVPTAPAKKAKQTEIKQETFGKAFIRKELKSILGAPTLMFQTVLSVFMPILLVIFLSFSLNGATATGDESVGLDGPLFTVGMLLYVSALLSSATNPFAGIGISREGRTLSILKALPISGAEVVKLKYKFSVLFSVASVITLPFIPFFVTNAPWYSGIAIAVICLLTALGLNAVALKMDLASPHLSWQNLTELLKNNKRSLKFIVRALIIGLVYFVIGIVMSIQTSITGTNAYLSLFGSCGLIALVTAVAGLASLFGNFEKVNDLYSRIEV